MFALILTAIKNIILMKYFLSILLFSIISVNAYSQFSIPGKVKKAFKTQYPEATDVNWINKPFPESPL